MIRHPQVLDGVSGVVHLLHLDGVMVQGHLGDVYRHVVADGLALHGDLHVAFDGVVVRDDEGDKGDAVVLWEEVGGEPDVPDLFFCGLRAAVGGVAGAGVRGEAGVEGDAVWHGGVVDEEADEGRGGDGEEDEGVAGLLGDVTHTAIARVVEAAFFVTHFGGFFSCGEKKDFLGAIFFFTWSETHGLGELILDIVVIIIIVVTSKLFCE